MKKKILSIILIVIIVMIVSITTTYATNYLYNSNEVYYDNTNSNIASSDVQGAIDELYTEATNYSSINTRVTALENNYTNIGTIYTTSDSASIATTNEVVLLGSFTLPSNGVWLINTVVSFQADSTGKRQLRIFSDATLKTEIGGLIGRDSATPNSNTRAYLASSFAEEISYSKTYYIGVTQNSGSTLDVQYSVNAVKIK